MTLALHVVRGSRLLSDMDTPDSVLAIYPELQAYFATLSEYPAIFQLSNLDPYNDQDIDSDWKAQLLIDLDRLQGDALADLRIPAPRLIESDLTEDDSGYEPFGRDGLLAWIDECRQLVRASNQPQYTLRAIGD